MTTRAQPGNWYAVEGKPFQVPYRDRLGTAIKEGDEVLYPTDPYHLAVGRIMVIFSGSPPLCRIRNLEGPMNRRGIYRETTDLVLKP